MANQIKHYGVLGMRWGHRRANGGSTVQVGRGVKGAAKEVGGLVKDAVKDDVAKAKAVGSKIVNSKAFKTMVFDKDNTTGLVFNKAEVKKVGDFMSKLGGNMKTGFHKWQIKSQDRDIKLFEEIANGLKNSKNPRDQKLAKEHADAAAELRRDLESLYTPEELTRYRGG